MSTKSSHGIKCLIPTEILGDISAPGTRLLRQGARIVLAGPDALPALASWRDAIAKEIDRLQCNADKYADRDNESGAEAVERKLALLDDSEADFVLSNVLRNYGTPFELPAHLRIMLSYVDRDYWMASPEAQNIRMCANCRFVTTTKQEETPCT